ncbi:hypothetical protein G6F51_014671 [Rhizopus arrhizus]|uniref:Uncharacterized protein n=1 Tax=Rhizopus oryzae TaxID=64495 RepID=A0A9P7BYT9_RHIOR|nr:hypothetical protein G6F51_014671 [Rhizopus arrhizus]
MVQGAGCVFRSAALHHDESLFPDVAYADSGDARRPLSGRWRRAIGPGRLGQHERQRRRRGGGCRRDHRRRTQRLRAAAARRTADADSATHSRAA